jgi:hypothetical protein
LSGCAFAQGGYYQDKAEGHSLNSNVLVAIPNATIRVCADQACTTPVSIFSDVALTHLIGSGTVADANGNFSFFAAPGLYWCQQSGLGFITQTAQCQVGLWNTNFSNIDNILYVDGTKYPCTAAGVIAMLSGATGQANAEGCLTPFTSSAEFEVPTGISFKHPSTSTWTWNVTDGVSCGIEVFNGGSYIGENSPTSGFTMTAAGTANMDSLLCNDLTGGNYTRAENLLLYNPNGGTFVNGLLHLENAQDGTAWRNITVANYSGIGVHLKNDCCTASTWNVVSNGNYGANAQPWFIDAPDTNHIVAATSHFAPSIVHPGVGKNNLLLTGTNRFWCHGNSFFGLYMEGAKSIGDTTTAAIDDNCYGGLLIAGASLSNDDASSTRYLLKIESGSEGVTALNLESGISNNIVNDLQTGVNVVAAHAYQPINYVSTPSYFTNFHMLGSTYVINLLNSASAPTLASGFGTSPSVVFSNGTAEMEINIGTGGSATSGVINLNATATNGWDCRAQDMNTNIVTRETAFTTTSVTLTAASAWTASDKLLVHCGAF